MSQKERFAAEERTEVIVSIIVITFIAIAACVRILTSL